jgi:hypothetical protein
VARRLIAFGVRWLILFAYEPTRSRAPSLILAAILILIGVQMWSLGIVADVIAVNWGRESEGQGPGQFYFGLHRDSGHLEIRIADADRGTIVSAREQHPLPLGEWHHVAFVADGGTLRLYRNGVEVAAADYGRLTVNGRVKSLGIGTKPNAEGTAPSNSDHKFWHGRIDELALFNHALAPEQVKLLYERSLEAATE